MGTTIADVHRQLYWDLRARGWTHDQIERFRPEIASAGLMSVSEAHFGMKLTTLIWVTIAIIGAVMAAMVVYTAVGN